MKIKIKYFDKEMERLCITTGGDLIDLRTMIDVDMKKGDFFIIPLGVAMELPPNTEAHIYPRSSTFKRYKIIMANSVGIVDNAYRGNGDMWGFPAIAMEDTHIDKGTRIAQFRVFDNQPPIDFEEVDELENEDRGGYGSTGWK